MGEQFTEYGMCALAGRHQKESWQRGLSGGHGFLLALAIHIKNRLWASSFIREGRIWIYF